MKKSTLLTYAGIFSFFLQASAENPVTVNLLVPAQGSTTPDTRPSNNPFIAHSLDSSIPAPTNFRWSVSGNSRPATYMLFVSEDTTFDTADIVAQNYSDTTFPLWNLKINTPYYWKVSEKDSLTGLKNSSVFSFTTADAWPRMIYIDGTTNVRDIGGRRNMDGLMIKQGLFYRSAEFNQTYTVTQKGLAQLKRLGIVCEIDLRSNSENPQITMPWLRLYERPVNDMGAGMNSYLDGLMNAQGSVCSVFKTMADRFNYPMILHCRIGADRTGTIVALLEALLGCSELQMGQNYIWTSLSVNGIRDTASQDWHDVLSYLKSFDTKNSTVQAGAWNYLQHIGMSVAELIAIRIIFLNDNRQPFPSLAVRMQPVAPGTRGAAAGKRYRLALSRSPVIVENGMGKATMFDVSGKALKPEWSSRQYSRLPLGR